MKGFALRDVVYRVATEKVENSVKRVDGSGLGRGIREKMKKKDRWPWSLWLRLDRGLVGKGDRTATRGITLSTTKSRIRERRRGRITG